MTKKFNRGFTLIELLVVIAIIGILSSVVLASLNTARGKGANAAVKSNLNNMRAQAELAYDSNSQSYNTVCNATQDPNVAKAEAAAQSAGGAATLNNAAGVAGSLTSVTCHSSATAWAMEAPLKAAEGTNVMWCVDSTGTSGGRTGTVLTASGATQFACQ